MASLAPGQLYVDGVLRNAAGDRTYDDIGPWTGEVIAQAADASAEDMEEAIAAARRAFDETDWSTDHARRRALVARLGELLVANQERIGEIVRLEGGAAWGTVLGPQVQFALDAFDGVLKIFDQFEWEKDKGVIETFFTQSQRIIRHEAYGVVAAITPWNVPLYVNVGKLVPALLAGCTVILKPAPETPLSAAIIGELAAEAGFPAGVFNVVTGKDPALLGEMLTGDPRIDLVTFTGSTATGKRIMERGAQTLKRVFLELGGKSAQIVLEDAPDYAMTVASSMLIYHAGQGCANCTRLLLPRSRYAEGVAILEQAYAHVQWGGIDDRDNYMGPLISERQRQRVMGYIAAGKAEGARLIAGGGIPADKGDGFFVEPTCFVDVDNKMKIAQEEIFGPVLVVIPFEDDEDAIRIANDSIYGLSGAVVTGDLDRGMAIAKRIRAGTYSVNGGIWAAPDVPFGGYKQSGLGREWGEAGFEEYLQIKTIGLPAKVAAPVDRTEAAIAETV